MRNGEEKEADGLINQPMPSLGGCCQPTLYHLLDQSSASELTQVSFLQVQSQGVEKANLKDASVIVHNGKVIIQNSKNGLPGS